MPKRPHHALVREKRPQHSEYLLFEGEMYLQLFSEFRLSGVKYRRLVVMAHRAVQLSAKLFSGKSEALAFLIAKNVAVFWGRCTVGAKLGPKWRAQETSEEDSCDSSWQERLS